MPDDATDMQHQGAAESKVSSDEDETDGDGRALTGAGPDQEIMVMQQQHAEGFPDEEEAHGDPAMAELEPEGLPDEEAHDDPAVAELEPEGLPDEEDVADGEAPGAADLVSVADGGQGESAEEDAAEGEALVQRLQKASRRQAISEGDLSTGGAGTFAAARPGTCCTLPPQRSYAWSQFKSRPGFQQNVSQGQPIVVSCGDEVAVDEDVDVKGLQVLGSLTFRDGADVTISTDYVFVCGSFSIGSPSRRHESKVEIVLRKGASEFTWPHGPHGPKNFGIAPFVTYGGSLYIRGSQCERTAWTRLQEEVKPAVVPGINVARGKPATQSSYSRRRTSWWSNGKGTDGSYHWKWGAVLTDWENNPFWSVRVDSLSKTGVERVVLADIRRSSKPLRQARVVVSDGACQRGTLCSGLVCSYKRLFRKATKGSLRHIGFEEFDCGGAKGSHIHLQLEGRARLWFAEMEVHAAASDATYDLKVEPSATIAWRAGDRILIAPSQKEVGEVDTNLRVVSVAGSVVKVKGRMRYWHDGCNTAFASCVQAAEVASLDRNVQIRGEWGCESSKDCGHFMIAHTNTAYVCGAQFTNLGQTAREGRYPLHIHLPGDSPDMIVRDNAVVQNHNRGVVMHGVNEMLVASNVVYLTKGHCFMLEDAIEMKNRIHGNLAIHPQSLSFGCGHGHDFTFLCPDRSDGGPNAFWISNPGNDFYGNVGIAAGAAFFMETRHVFGLTRRKYAGELQRAGLGNGKIKGRVKLLRFSNNLAHSGWIGMGNYPRSWNPDGSPMVYENFTCYHCRQGLLARGGTFVFKGARIFDCFVALVSNQVMKIYVNNSFLTSNGWAWTQRRVKIVSAPTVIRKLIWHSDLRNDFSIDTATKAWVLQHGGYDWAALKKLPGNKAVLFQ